MFFEEGLAKRGLAFVMEIFSNPNLNLNWNKSNIEDPLESSEITCESENDNEMLDKKEYLAFILSGEEYAIDIMMIKEIAIPMELTWVPRAPEFVQGIISLRGTILPILNLKPRLQLNGGSSGSERRIIVVSIENEGIGLMVDAVAGVVKIADTEIVPPTEKLNKNGSVYFKGIGKFQERFIIFMDIQSLLLSAGFLSSNG